jgi:amiloride-sensitive sodium channel
MSFLISTAVAAYFILTVWNKWDTSPVLVSFANAPTSVWKLPFPAITICPEVKIKNSLFNYSEIYSKNNKTDEE